MVPSKRVVLHIGTEKTGTSALQTFFHLNRKALMADGLLFPQTPGRKSHTRLVLYAASADRNRKLRLSERLADEREFELFREVFPEVLHGEIELNSPKIVVFSSEHLSSRLRRETEIEKVRHLIAPIGDVQIVCYLRRQEELVVSSHSTKIKSGSTSANISVPDDSNMYFNYDTLLSLWEGVFGIDRIVVRLYEQDKLANGDVVDDFFAVLGLQVPPNANRPKRLNERMGANGLAILRQLNAYIPRFEGDRPNPERADLVEALQAIQPDQSVYLSPAQIDEIRGRFAASNTRVAERYFDRKELFSARSESERAPTGPTLDENELIRIMAHLWKWKQGQLTTILEEIGIEQKKRYRSMLLKK